MHLSNTLVHDELQEDTPWVILDAKAQMKWWECHLLIVSQQSLNALLVLAVATEKLILGYGFKNVDFIFVFDYYGRSSS